MTGEKRDYRSGVFLLGLLVAISSAYGQESVGAGRRLREVRVDSKEGLSRQTLELETKVGKLRSLHAKLSSCELLFRKADHPGIIQIRLTTNDTGASPKELVKHFSTDRGEVLFDLQAPKDARAILTIELPNEQLKGRNVIDLDDGKITVDAALFSGDVLINVGAGKVSLNVKPEEQDSVAVNIGAGKIFVVHADKTEATLIRSWRAAGRGVGSFILNIGAGVVYIAGTSTR